MLRNPSDKHVIKLTYTSTEKKDSTPMLWYGACAFTYLGAMLASNKALQWVSYPTQVLGKSCKPIPVMILGVLLARKSYPLTKYLCVFLIVAGVALFMYKENMLLPELGFLCQNMLLLVLGFLCQNMLLLELGFLCQNMLLLVLGFLCQNMLLLELGFLCQNMLLLMLGFLCQNMLLLVLGFLCQNMLLLVLGFLCQNMLLLVLGFLCQIMLLLVLGFLC
ncbi:hypothetical protein QZH41_000880 [Actinostola sp. cb2023]|nr:hypothetical protein QZH41_000880 [Actinostola sp. cb2023]